MSLLEKVRTNLVKFDCFGETIGFNIKGQKSYGTVFGSLLSILISALTMVYAWSKFFHMQNYDDTQYQQKINQNWLDQNREYSL